MTVEAGPNIVETGLQLHLDAANSKSYPGTGTTWTDLSGNGNHGTLVNTPTYTSGSSAYFTFNGGNYVSFSYAQPAQTTSTSFSWNIWLYATRNNSADVFIGNRGTTLEFTKITSANAEYYPTSLGGSIPMNSWQNICFIKNGTTLSYYRNGTLISSTTSNTTKTSIPFYLGGDPTASEYSIGRISLVGVYNTGLSESQVKQNFNALRGRYGI